MWAHSSARILSQDRTANFEHFEMCRVCINFKVFKVASVDPARRTNFEHFEVCGGTSNLKVFKVTTGPRIAHDTPCRASPVPEPRKDQAAKNHAGAGGAGLRQPTPSLPSRSPCWFVPPTTAGAPWPSRENGLNFENFETATKPRRGRASTLNFGLGSRGRG